MKLLLMIADKCPKFSEYCEILLTALPSQSHRRGNGWADGEAEAAGDFILS